MLEILIYNTYMIIYKENNQVVGMASVYKYNCQNKLLVLLYKIIQKILFYSPKIKFKNQLKEYYKVYNYIPKDMKTEFDGEISMLIVSKDVRGKGIGKLLFAECCDIAKKCGIERMRIDTDESCNYNFYLKSGCSKVYETIIQSGEKSIEKAFVLEKVF